jgi:chitinase
VQATDGGGTVGLAQTNDVVTLTYAGTVNPDLILSGWDGSAVAVTVRIAGNGPNDVLTVHDASDDSVLTGLGLVDLNGNYANSTSMDFTGSQMTLSGSVVTIVLGTRVGIPHLDTTAKAMTWSTPEGTATESGPLDADF